MGNLLTTARPIYSSRSARGRPAILSRSERSTLAAQLAIRPILRNCSTSFFNEHLNLGEVVLGIAPQDHSRTLEVHLPGGHDDFVALFLDECHDLAVGPGQLLVGPLVEERDAAAARKFAHRDTLHGLALANGHARLEIGAVLLEFGIVV